MMKKFYFRYGTVYYPLALIAVIVAGAIGSSALAIAVLLGMTPHIFAGLYLATGHYITYVKEIRSVVEDFLPEPPNRVGTR